MRRSLFVLTAFGLLISACSGSAAIETTTTAPTSTTTTIVETTTTTEPTTTTSEPGDPSPINGLPVSDPALLDRRVLAVKIDNHPQARPQSGINEADAVVEVLVEGVTRFITLWQQSDTEYLGPNRSGRPTDASLLPAFGEPTFNISGAQDWVQSLIRSKGIHLIGEVRPATFRISSRGGPHNLYVNTNLLREYADGREYPNDPQDGPMWEFGALPATASPVESVKMNFRGNITNWTWDATEAAWLRSASGVDSNWLNEDGTTGRIAMPVMVALAVEQYTASPPSGVSGKALPSSKTIGSGKAYVFADGKVVEGTWEREAETEWFTLKDSAGNIIPVPAGKIWISLVPDGDITLTPAS
jgi:Protein of unknown function (DUF3048) N-terminal domain/Protein of unknown function (DUF3048) C-terminal domain